LGDKLGDTAGDRYAVLVELALPQHARQHRAAELQLGADVARRRALMRTKARAEGAKVEQVESGHVGASFRVVQNHQTAGWPILSPSVGERVGLTAQRSSAGEHATTEMSFTLARDWIRTSYHTFRCSLLAPEVSVVFATGDACYTSAASSAATGLKRSTPCCK